MKPSLRKPSVEESESGTERWLVSYADFITLMFAFFVILYATSDRDKEKTKRFQESVEKFLIKAGSFGESGARVEQGEKNFAVIEPPIQTFRPNKPDDTKLMDSLQNEIESKFTEAERKKFLLDLSPEDKGVRIVLSGAEIFSGDSAKLSPAAVKFVDHLAGILKASQKRVMIEGYVTSREHGEYPSTWDLASARSVNLLRYMIRTVGFPEKQLAASTYGDSRTEGRKVAGNDRLDLVVYYNDSEF